MLIFNLFYKSNKILGIAKLLNGGNYVATIGKTWNRIGNGCVSLYGSVNHEKNLA